MNNIAGRFTVGQHVRHADGNSGTVTRVHENGMVEWRTCGQWRISGQEALSDKKSEPLPRWRTSKSIT